VTGENSVEQGENFTKEEWAALSPEQQNEALRIEKAVRTFLVDSRSIRYVEMDSNKTALLNFLETHGLDVTHRNLLFAFDSLGDALQLVPFAPVVQQPPAPSQRPIPVPTAPDPRQPQFYRNGRAIPYTNARPL